MSTVSPDSMQGAPRVARAGGPSRWERWPAAPLLLSVVLLGFTRLPRVHDNPRLLWSVVGAAGLLAAWSLLLVLTRRGRGFPIELAPPRQSHYIQASVQICIYLYWGWYWRAVYDEAPLFLAQFIFLYAFDALLSWTRGRNWRLGFGPLPIVLSINIFLWFKDDWYVWQFALIATGALAKDLIQWTRSGRRAHVFNPSAFPLALCSLILITTGLTDLTYARDIATTVTGPPYIYLEVFFLGLIVQYFFSVTLITLTAVATLCGLNLLYTKITGVYLFIDTNIPVPVFIGLHFLVTDPATSPRTNAGRILFGALYGAMSFTLAGAFGYFGIPTLYDKLLPIPFLNLLVPFMDRVAGAGLVGRFSRWESAFAPRRLNLAHMGVWIALFGLMFTTGYVEAPHPGASIAFWKQAVEQGKPMAHRGLLATLTAQVDRGSGDAWNELGLLHLEGKLVKGDTDLAAHEFAQGAQLGSRLACINLVTQHFFLGGPCSVRDLSLALGHLDQECAAGGGDGRACYLLGAAFELGRGRPHDPAHARQLYETACTQGCADACKRLEKLRARDATAPAAPAATDAPPK